MCNEDSRWICKQYIKRVPALVHQFMSENNSGDLVQTYIVRTPSGYSLSRQKPNLQCPPFSTLDTNSPTLSQTYFKIIGNKLVLTTTKPISRVEQIVPLLTDTQLLQEERTLDLPGFSVMDKEILEFVSSGVVEQEDNIECTASATIAPLTSSPTAMRMTPLSKGKDISRLLEVQVREEEMTEGEESEGSQVHHTTEEEREEGEENGPPVKKVKRTPPVMTTFAQILLMLSIDLRMEDCYQFNRKLQVESKDMVKSASRFLRQIMIVWNKLLSKHPGNLSLQEFCRLNPDHTLCKMSCTSTACVTVMKFLHELGLEQQTCGIQEQKKKVSSSSRSTNKRTSTTSTSYMTAIGLTPPADVPEQNTTRDQDDLDTLLKSIPFQEEDGVPCSAIYTEKGDHLYTLRSEGQCGRIFVNLSLTPTKRMARYNSREQWRAATFRGKVYTNEGSKLHRLVLEATTEMVRLLKAQGDATANRRLKPSSSS